MVDWMNYSKIQEQKRKGFKKSQVARKLRINRETVIVYWNMTPNEYAVRIESAKARIKKVDPHREYVYVNSIREEYDIKKPETSRQYEAMDDLPLGRQAQIDMGVIGLEIRASMHKKVYCLGMVMTHSRYKFILWQVKPFTTDNFVQAHIKAFDFFGGFPQEMVYDQDKILAFSENNGDIIYKKGFQSYVNEVKFDIFRCHGADLESKGLIENVVKYAKHGFAEHRIFMDRDSLNVDCVAWLKRTGNKNIHGTTLKVPAEVFTLEKEYLLPVSEYNFSVTVNHSISYLVRKDNIVCFLSSTFP